jgi:hypothetical protein
MEDQGWNALGSLVDKFGWIWALVFGAIFLLLSRLNVLQRIFVGRQEAENIKHEQLSEDTQRLIDNLQRDADKQRQWRIESDERNERIIVNLRDDVSKLIESVRLSEKGNSKLRHMIDNILVWGADVRIKAALALPITPFPLDELMTVDSDLAKKLQDIFDEGDQIIERRKKAEKGE